MHTKVPVSANCTIFNRQLRLAGNVVELVVLRMQYVKNGLVTASN